MRRVRFLTTAAIALALVVATGGTASAAEPEVGPQAACGNQFIYKAANASITFTQAAGPNSSVTGGPGVTLAISKTTTFTVDRAHVQDGTGSHRATPR